MSPKNPHRKAETPQERVIYLDPQQVQHPDGRLEHPTVHRESRDASLRLVLAVLLGGLLVGGAAGFATWRFVMPEQGGQRRSYNSYAPPPLATELPPPPRLDPLMLKEPELREPRPYGIEAVERLHRFGPTDEAGFVHIPIDQAIELTAGTLPAPKSLPNDTVKDQGLVGGGESNSGRLYQDLPSWLKTAYGDERQQNHSPSRARAKQP